MSLFEVLDLIVYNALVKFTSRKVRPQMNPQIIDVAPMKTENES